MSAIFGVWNRGGQPVNGETLRTMSARLAHRGGDGTGIVVRDFVGFGHRLLHTTPESLHEVQPVHASDVPLLLCADARVDNRDEILAHTALRGRKPQQVSDAELILAAWQRWGAEAPFHLRGDFAFAIWDDRDQSLHLVRDPMGVRSLYYHAGAGIVAFATEIKALFAVPEVPRKLDELRVAEYLEVQLDDVERTFHEGVLRVPAAHTIRIDRKGVHKTRYWRLDADVQTRLRNDAEYSEALLEMFTRAVQYRVRSVFPVAATLSGGLDSSGIACLARNILAQSGGPPLHSISAVFPGLPEGERMLADETPFMNAVIATGGFIPHMVAVDHLAPFYGLDRAMHHLDEPPLSYSLYMHWAMYDEARRAGARVFLDGLDGDACIGYGRELPGDLALEGSWDDFEREIRALAQVFPSKVNTPSALARLYGVPVLEGMAADGKVLRSLGAINNLGTRFGIGRTGLAVNHAIRPMLSRIKRALAPFAREETAAPLLAARSFARRVGFQTRKATQPARRVSASESHRESLEMPSFQLALDVADKATAAFALQAAYPFFDRDLMQLCVSFPVGQKLSRGWPRAVYRRAMEGILPRDVQWRSEKQDIAPAFIRGLQGSGKPLLDSILQERSHPQGARYLNWETITASYDRFIRPDGRRRLDGDAMTLYRAAVLCEWLRNHNPSEVRSS